MNIDKLVEIRKEKKIQQKVMADYLEVSANTLRGYETGQVEIPFCQAIKYANLLGLEVAFIIKEKLIIL